MLCLGNELLTDDAFGYWVARKARQRCVEAEGREIVFAALAGFGLLELLGGRRKVLIVDSIRTHNSRPGTLHMFPMGTMTPSKHLTCSHQINLPTALEFGRQLGIRMPEDIDVLAVEVQDVETLSDQMTQPVEQAVDAAVDLVFTWLARAEEEQNHGKHGRRVVTIDG